MTEGTNEKISIIISEVNEDNITLKSTKAIFILSMQVRKTSR